MKPVEAVKPPPPVLGPSCYTPPPKKGAALLTVSSKRPVRVELDGERICTPVVGVPVSPGSHKLTMIDLKSGAREEQTQRFVAGAKQKVEAFLKGPR